MASLTQLTYVDAVDRFRHFGKAAKHCHVSQPSLSSLIQKLEDELGTVIFDRSQKPVKTTEIGKKLVAQARRVLEESRKLEAVARGQTGLQGELKLGIIPTVSPYLLPRFITAFAKAHPGVSVYVEELHTNEIVRRLNEESLDAGILATPLVEPGIHERRLFYEPFFLYVHNDHTLAKHKIVKEKDLSGEGAWLLADGHCLRHQMMQVCRLTHSNGGLNNVSFESGHLETLKQLVRIAGGFTLLPGLAVLDLQPQDARLIRGFIDPVPMREISLIYTRAELKKDVLEELYQQIRNHLPKEIGNLEKSGSVLPPT